MKLKNPLQDGLQPDEPRMRFGRGRAIQTPNLSIDGSFTRKPRVVNPKDGSPILVLSRASRITGFVHLRCNSLQQSHRLAARFDPAIYLPAAAAGPETVR